MDDGRYTANIFIDVKKAFDTVDHDILLAKLRKYGVENLELAWFTSYLNNRKQFCKVNGICSKTKDIHCGVPQGSCLGPLQSPENITVARSLTGGRLVKQWKFGGRFVKIEI